MVTFQNNVTHHDAQFVSMLIIIPMLLSVGWRCAGQPHCLPKMSQHTNIKQNKTQEHVFLKHTNRI